jgi:hypothetical protein
VFKIAGGFQAFPQTSAALWFFQLHVAWAW